MKRNDKTDRLILWLYVTCDFIILNIVLALLYEYGTSTISWTSEEDRRLFFVINNAAFILAGQNFHIKISERLISAGEMVKNTTLHILEYMLIAYVLMRYIIFWKSAVWVVLETGAILYVVLLIMRQLERIIIKKIRKSGRNSRSVTLIGSDRQLWYLHKELLEDPARGYRVLGYYADEESEEAPVSKLGTLDELKHALTSGEHVDLGDEAYVCLSRMEKSTIQMLSQYCDSQVTRFFYIPVSVESLQLNMKREHIGDLEIYATHESPLLNPLNTLFKRLFDIVVSLTGLLVMAILFPIIWLIIKIQSPGPIFFSQYRTGLDGKDFRCYKFRSMHVNKDADRVQATKDDPRKFPFGNLMRKLNIDELPQFWNVLKGDMSVVGPRPHMLLHTDTYSRLIHDYMVRHFVKPGVTGWAQVTGYRGETTHLWQMEGRIKRDIWYVENWSFWLDLHIIVRTFLSIFIHDKNAY